MQFLKNIFAGLSEYRQTKTALGAGKSPVAAFGLAHIPRVLLADALSDERRVLYLVADEAEASRVMEDFASLGTAAAFFPARDWAPQASAASSREYQQTRIGALSNILDKTVSVVVATAAAAGSATLPPDRLRDTCFSLNTGDAIPIDLLAGRLVRAGYSRADMIEGPGQFCVRGGIFDLFPPDNALPVRLEFFGDEIESIRSFDVESQRRLDELKSVKISPAAENAPDSLDSLADALSALMKTEKKQSDARRERLENDISRLRNGLPVAFDAYLPQIFPRRSTLFDYLPDAVVLFSDTSRINEHLLSYDKLMAEDVAAFIEDGVLPVGGEGFFMGRDDLLATAAGHPEVYMESFIKSSFERSPACIINYDLQQFAVSSGGGETLAEDISDYNGTTVLLAHEEKAAQVLTDDLGRRGIPAIFARDPSDIREGAVVVTTGSLSAGIEFPKERFRLLCVGRNPGKKRRAYFKKGADIGSLEELNPGDYVVHTAHGIGIFDGVRQLTTATGTKDYIKICYQGRDVLYVPVSSLDLVSRYIGNRDDVNVKLNRLGSPEWSNTKKRIRGAVRDMAKQLIKLYAERMRQPGYAFGPDTDLQRDFEARFPYEETDDQIRCAAEIKDDMERSVPMDRLLCGDVGFGKTEVALRAAFKCVAEGKQCALLVPTTILAWQHYRTILDRMGTLPVNVEMLSRFRTAAEQRRIKKDLAAGNVDIIVGTHRIISGDVNFRDLGLLIIDEEQRFGVAQKERLKEKFPTVDVLTLSATPIPRTLNMALSGLRDMSSIEEAPGDRFPVQTYVIEQDTGVLLEAINRELRRGGQVYYLHNRVDSITATAARLQKLLPEARVGVAHGKMGEEELSAVWRQLLEHEIDVLVCTTIIETGVDVPNANTLIIEDADNMGLSQLHQLRGRVGRSHRRAFAYFCFRGGKALNETAAKRLDAICQYTQFGSGFKIAMRDLEIRGAGSLLGGEQHGHMESVGYDMYLKLLNDAINEEKGIEVKPEIECAVELTLGAHIPERYIPVLSQRLSMYRRIAAIRTPEDAEDALDELRDRFGEPPSPVKQLIDVSLIKTRAAAAGISEVTEQNGSVLLYFAEFDSRRTSALSAGLRGRVMVNAGRKPYAAVRIQADEGSLATLSRALDVLENNCGA